MTDVAIRCEHLSKQYRIGEQERYKALRDVITDSVASPFRRLRAAMSNGNGSTRNSKPETRNSIWALDDVSFEVKRGEVVGIIGRNGAGKSTLLKILSRITKPTKGHARIHGRVGSLLEVGTGFHPELTGRENIFLNGAILGMRKTEIERKFDEIVAFAEVEKFIDTPVKRYSSGMYVRLAFAVAAHMETEILLIDEVLAVGDEKFQKKCIGKMKDIGRGGRTVFFVSHNMAAVRKLCTKGLVLNAGRLAANSDIESCVKHYSEQAEDRNESTLDLDFSEDRPQFKSLKLLEDTIDYSGVIQIETEIVTPYDTEVGIEVEIHDARGLPLIYTSTAPMGNILLGLKAEKINRFQLDLGPLNLATGEYQVYFWLIRPWLEFYHAPRQALVFTVSFSDPFNSGFDFRQSYSRGATTVPICVSQLDSSDQLVVCDTRP